MILDKELNQIKKEDYLYRFILLQKVMEKYAEKFSVVSENEELEREHKRYMKLVHQVQKLQQLAATFNIKMNNKHKQCGLVLEDLENQYSKVVEMLEQSNSVYEQSIMKTWRETIKINNIKQEQHQKQKLLKGGNNKNLMFLTSQIFKKQRIGLSLIQQQSKKFSQQLKAIEGDLQQESRTFQTSKEEFDELLFNTKQKNLNSSKKKKKYQIEKLNSISSSFEQLQKNVNFDLETKKEQFEKSHASIFEILNDLVGKLK